MARREGPVMMTEPQEIDGDLRASAPEHFGVTDATDIGGGVMISIVRQGDVEMAVNTWHECTGHYGAGMHYLDNEQVREIWPHGPFVTVEQRDPLTLAEPVACEKCGLTGHIREGRWVT